MSGAPNADMNLNTDPNVDITAPVVSEPNVDPAAPNPADPSVVPPAFQPDFKFKVMDETHEIPEKFRSIVKTEEDLKEVRRVFEQAYGLKHLEASRDEFKNKYSSAEPRLNEYAQVEQRLTKLSHFVQQNDFSSFFNELKIPEKTIFQWVKSRLDEMALAPEVRAQIEQNRQNAARAYDQEQELSMLRAQQAQMQQQQQMQMIDQTIVSTAGDVANEFNTRMGTPDAFRNAVINKGFAIQQSTGQSLPVSQVIELVKQDLARVMGITGSAGNPAAPAAPGAPQPPGQPAPAGNPPPVIPAVKAGGGSPVAQSPRSIEDLKKIYNQL